eukprot:CAMPEP_0113635292 /NCGR_PEP_ID=MMETSP0017_2-20120614/18401_1 /TAXON_ID=2856 /ORGANISM="Cylindrotheca closterium" /LENGTH=58 /DNA_ID=CAMNT_0000546075 /DNA_START=692 /DNA_END=868 /DNA_ORIENTATION=+ /assembly_acc=CAM_ASM_000147
MYGEADGPANDYDYHIKMMQQSFHYWCDDFIESRAPSMSTLQRILWYAKGGVGDGVCG